MEKQENLKIETEEELYTEFNKIFLEFINNDFETPSENAKQILKDLVLCEQKAKEYSVISPNEDLEGNYKKS